MIDLLINFVIHNSFILRGGYMFGVDTAVIAAGVAGAAVGSAIGRWYCW